jgi:hypothetical protein
MKKKKKNGTTITMKGPAAREFMAALGLKFPEGSAAAKAFPKRKQPPPKNRLNRRKTNDAA